MSFHAIIPKPSYAVVEYSPPTGTDGSLIVQEESNT